MKTIKASKKEIELHQAIVAGDSLALSRLYDLYGNKIVENLSSWYKKIAAQDDSQILQAVNEAFWGYYKNPTTFDIREKTLKRFLEMAAERDLLNIIDKNNRLPSKKELPTDVELEHRFWNSITEDDNPTDGRVIENELLAHINTELSSHFNNDLDIRLAKLILMGERRTEVFSKLLALEHKNIDEQRSKVKKHKDRIKKVLDRHEVEARIKSILR